MEIALRQAQANGLEKKPLVVSLSNHERIEPLKRNG
jgi:hypothetical protein